MMQGNDAVSGKICIVPYSILEKLVDNGRIRPEQVSTRFSPSPFFAHITSLPLSLSSPSLHCSTLSTSLLSSPFTPSFLSTYNMFPHPLTSTPLLAFPPPLSSSPLLPSLFPPLLASPLLSPPRLFSLLSPSRLFYLLSSLLSPLLPSSLSSVSS
jgi:hypothetical protein